jgi:hypothetical protein
MQPFANPHKDETDLYTRGKSWRSKTDWSDHRLESPHSSSLTTALE